MLYSVMKKQSALAKMIEILEKSLDHLNPIYKKIHDGDTPHNNRFTTKQHYNIDNMETYKNFIDNDLIHSEHQDLESFLPFSEALKIADGRTIPEAKNDDDYIHLLEGHIRKKLAAKGILDPNVSSEEKEKLVEEIRDNLYHVIRRHNHGVRHHSIDESEQRGEIDSETAEGQRQLAEDHDYEDQVHEDLKKQGKDIVLLKNEDRLKLGLQKIPDNFAKDMHRMTDQELQTLQNDDSYSLKRGPLFREKQLYAKAILDHRKELGISVSYMDKGKRDSSHTHSSTEGYHISFDNKGGGHPSEEQIEKAEEYVQRVMPEAQEQMKARQTEDIKQMLTSPEVNWRMSDPKVKQLFEGLKDQPWIYDGGAAKAIAEEVHKVKSDPKHLERHIDTALKTQHLPEAMKGMVNELRMHYHNEAKKTLSYLDTMSDKGYYEKKALHSMYGETMDHMHAINEVVKRNDPLEMVLMHGEVMRNLGNNPADKRHQDRPHGIFGSEYEGGVPDMMKGIREKAEKIRDAFKHTDDQGKVFFERLAKSVQKANNPDGVFSYAIMDGIYRSIDKVHNLLEHNNLDLSRPDHAALFASTANTYSMNAYAKAHAGEWHVIDALDYHEHHLRDHLTKLLDLSDPKNDAHEARHLAKIHQDISSETHGMLQQIAATRKSSSTFNDLGGNSLFDKWNQGFIESLRSRENAIRVTSTESHLTPDQQKILKENADSTQQIADKFTDLAKHVDGSDLSGSFGDIARDFISHDRASNSLLGNIPVVNMTGAEQSHGQDFQDHIQNISQKIDDTLSQPTTMLGRVGQRIEQKYAQTGEAAKQKVQQARDLGGRAVDAAGQKVQDVRDLGGRAVDAAGQKVQDVRQGAMDRIRGVIEQRRARIPQAPEMPQAQQAPEKPHPSIEESQGQSRLVRIPSAPEPPRRKGFIERMLRRSMQNDQDMGVILRMAIEINRQEQMRRSFEKSQRHGTKKSFKYNSDRYRRIVQ